MRAHPWFVVWWVIGLAAALGAAFWLAARWRARRRAREDELSRVRSEDVLKHLCKAEAEGEAVTLATVAGVLQLPIGEAAGLLARMEQRGFLSFLGGRLQLTAAGREAGLQIVRAHRLWESHLAHETGVHPSEWHARAEEREHSLSPQDAAALAARLGHPTHDPHGDVIPAPDGVLTATAGQPLSTLPPGGMGRVVHIEDEPEAIRATLDAAGLHLGAEVRMIDKEEQRLRFWANGAEHSLAPIAAHHVDVLPLADDGRDAKSLADLRPGERATLLGLAQACRGAERQRLLDLGFVRDTEVTAEMTSPTGDPIAYRVRGSVIALRREQARLVLVRDRAARKSPS